jgi:2-C-methyl-D-erythritol 4-phosphate cytidylyltransferase
MLNGHRVGAVLLMGGVGSRFGSETPKQFHRLSGKAVYEVALEPFLEAGFIDEIVLSCHPDWIDGVTGGRVVAAGKTRQESSYLGLRGFSTPPSVVLIHDAVRPFVTVEILRENALLAIEHGAVDTCIPSADTLVHTKGKSVVSIPNRAEYLRGQTPQSFSYPLILEAHERAKGTNASDDCQLVLDMGHKVWIAKGDEQNIKITSELDLFLAEQLFRMRKRSISGDQSIAGKLYAVVGGTGGIGQAICQMLKEAGAIAIPLSRRTGFDLSDGESVRATLERLGPLDGLINCAGILFAKPLTSLHLSEIEEMLEVNLIGLIRCCKLAQFNPLAHIINIGSSSFARGRKDLSIYASAKAAVVNFTQALAEERPDLRIHAVIPQRTNTPLRTTNFPDEKPDTLLEPEKIAKTVLDLLKDISTTGMLVEVRKE